MGFLKRKKNNENKYNFEKKNEDINNIDTENNNNNEEEDDFSVIPQKPTRDEFRAAAAEHAAEAADESDVPDEEETEDTLEEENAQEQTDEIEDSENDVPIEDDGDDFEDDFSDGIDYGQENDNTDAAETEDFADDMPGDGKKEKRKGLSESQKKALKGVGIGAGVVVGICLCIYIYGCVTVPKDVIQRNVYIEDNDVSGLTYDEAVAKLQNASLLGNAKITLKCNDQTYEMSGADIGLSANLEDTVDKAMRYGKTGNILIDGFANALQLFSKHEVVPNAMADEATVREKLTEFGNQIYGELVEHQLEIGDGVVVVTPGHSGFDGNTDTAFEEVTEALDNEKFDNISVTLKSGSPHDLTVDQVDGFTYCDPVDAYYDIQGNDVMVIKEVPGRYINRDETANLITQVHEGGPTVNIPYYVSYASVTADQLQSKLFNATIASYSTSYGTSTANRCANVARAASKINGVVLAPGQVFSFNDTVGPRSVANGFYTAKEYVNGETVDGIGGGTCQVSSTLYNAVLYSDLSIVSRTNHMFPVGYCPIGQDATVADSGVDFKFMNSMDYPIKISAVTSGYTITVSIIGTQRDDPRTVKIENTSKAVGADTSVHSVRYVYNSAGELISTDDLGNSYYLAH